MPRLIQLNTWDGRLYRPIQTFLAAQKPDILHMQEVTSSPQGKTAFFDMLQIAQGATELKNTFFSPTMSKPFGEKTVYYGNAILSRTALEYTYDEFTHLQRNDSYEPDRDDYNIRLFQHAITTLESGTELHLVNYHGYHDRASKMGGALTERHFRRIAEYIAGLKGPVIFTGDMNVAPDSPSLKPIHDLLVHVGNKYNVTTTRNLFGRSQIPVDMIFTSAEIHIDHFEVLPDIISDHAALKLEFSV